ncbi:hypothetical protein YC2023_089927 [Brassica napus]
MIQTVTTILVLVSGDLIKNPNSISNCYLRNYLIPKSHVLSSNIPVRRRLNNEDSLYTPLDLSISRSTIDGETQEHIPNQTHSVRGQ